ncbi:MAG: O-antigen ligase family protein [Saprospiraceae bacterium]
MIWAFTALIFVAGLMAAAINSPLPLALPGAALVLGLGIRNIKALFLLCIVLIPLSTEVQLGSLGTDLPSEPLMWLLTGLGAVYFIRNATTIEGALLRHPISLALLLHLAWMFITVVTSNYPEASIKFFLAKLWYVIPFYALTTILLRTKADLHKLILAIAIPLTGVLIYCLVRHAALGFTFEDVNKAMAPFFRNHVSYAALTSIVLPFLVVGAFSFRQNSWWRYGLFAASLISLIAIQTSYTRAAYASLLIGVAVVVVMRFRLTKHALVLSLALVVAFGTFVVSNNRFFNFAPNYDKTITHTDFDNLLEATYKLEDISTMERVYRWVAGSYMSAEHPVVGFGPGNFHRYYKGYALESFRTYVSDNPEKSGIHNYYLMTLVEQGWLGLIIFILLAATGLISAERAYHRAKTRPIKLAVIIFASSLAINLSFQLINDMIETDKAGPWFFLCLAGIVVLDLKSKLDLDWESTKGNDFPTVP